VLKDPFLTPSVPKDPFLTPSDGGRQCAATWYTTVLMSMPM
jgi:hypothetical protein